MAELHLIRNRISEVNLDTFLHQPHRVHRPPRDQLSVPRPTLFDRLAMEENRHPAAHDCGHLCGL